MVVYSMCNKTIFLCSIIESLVESVVRFRVHGPDRTLVVSTLVFIMDGHGCRWPSVHLYDLTALCFMCNWGSTKSYETKCWVVSKMLVGERHYLVMQVTCKAALETSVVLVFFRNTTKISVSIFSILEYIYFLSAVDLLELSKHFLYRLHLG